MRVLLWLAMAVLCSSAQADLFTAQLAYQKGDYERAFKDYRELAELGQPQAQYNLAVMYAKGLGVRQSELNAYAWATLAAEGGYTQGKSLAGQLRTELAPGSEKMAEEIRAPFTRSALDERLMPKVEEETDTKTRCRTSRVPELSYPEAARRDGIQGTVFVEFSVLPDGSTRNPRILYAVPGGVFESSVRGYVLQMRYRPGGTTSAHCSVLFRFLLDNAFAAYYPDLETFVSKTKEKADAGNPEAEFMYGLLLAGLPQLESNRGEALPWFLKAAQGGSRNAQFQVGSRLLLGLGCHCEENKGELWLRKAAEADQSNAQVTLAVYALRGTPDAASTKRARLWLERAAASGDHDGMYYLAALLAATPIEEFRDPHRALDLLDKVKHHLGTDPTGFEVRAAAQASSAAYADAVRSERQAISEAQRLGWDLAPLRERLARYEANQPWYGDLLSL